MSVYYDIIIEGEPKYTRLSEEEFFDTMEDLSEGFYKEGTPHPSTVQHVTYQD